MLEGFVLYGAYLNHMGADMIGPNLDFMFKGRSPSMQATPQEIGPEGS